jgi:predicted alpha/beta-hydrolase family hydrolase
MLQMGVHARVNTGRPADLVLLAHGSGGSMGRELVESGCSRTAANPLLAKLDDSRCSHAAAVSHSRRTANRVFTSRFPAGDIGKASPCAAR